MRIDQRGFSLVELMAVLGVSSMIAYGMFMILQMDETQRQTIDRKAAIQEAARDGLYKMVQEIRQSALGQVTITAPQADYEVIQFNIPSTATPVNTDSTDAVEDYSTDWTTSDMIQYARGGADCDRIIRSVCTGGCPAVSCPSCSNSGTCSNTLQSNQKVIAVNVSGLDFDNTTDPDVVQITLKAQQTVYAHGERSLVVNSSGVSSPMSMTAKAELRNT